MIMPFTKSDTEAQRDGMICSKSSMVELGLEVLVLYAPEHIVGT